ncbi:hypothetical protein FKM82_022243 [Ascaphus truei]
MLLLLLFCILALLLLGYYSILPEESTWGKARMAAWDNIEIPPNSLRGNHKACITSMAVKAAIILARVMSLSKQALGWSLF